MTRYSFASRLGCWRVEIVRGTERGLALESLILEHELVVSSELYGIEVRNAFWKYTQAGVLSLSEARSCVQDALDLVTRFVPIDRNIDEAFLEAVRCKHPVYDMLYLTLARRHAATLLSTDTKLVRLCAELGVDCVEEVAL